MLKKVIADTDTTRNEASTKPKTTLLRSLILLPDFMDSLDLLKNTYPYLFQNGFQQIIKQLSFL